MSKRAKRRQGRHPAPNRNPGATPAPRPAAAGSGFRPVELRARHDGWTPGRQIAFVHALAASLCVDQACRAVGMSPRSYYDLRARPGSDSFRQAVDLALDVGTQRLEDAMLSRALHGEVQPVFHKGEQVGERRRYDNRLALALLRARRPDRYGRWRDRVVQVRDHPDGAALMLKEAVRRLAQDGLADRDNRPRPRRDPLRPFILVPRDGGEDDDAPSEAADLFTRASAAFDRGDEALGSELVRRMGDARTMGRGL